MSRKSVLKTISLKLVVRAVSSKKQQKSRGKGKVPVRHLCPRCTSWLLQAMQLMKKIFGALMKSMYESTKVDARLAVASSCYPVSSERQ